MREIVDPSRKVRQVTGGFLERQEFARRYQPTLLS